MNPLSLLLFGLCLSCAQSAIRRNAARRRSQRTRKPNIVLILTDDQDSELGSMEFMPKTLRIFRDEGAEFSNGFVSTPICCPSRSTILTGVYVHNHGVHTNSDNCSSYTWQQAFENRTFATYLRSAGYRTGYFGKYLNEYNGTYKPSGWNEWSALIKNSKFYNYSIRFNDRIIHHKDVYSEDYLTDLIANDSLTFLRHSKQHHRHKAVLMVLSMPAPHGPEDPAPQYSTWFANVTSHRTPSWNYAPNPDKQWLLQHTGKMEPVHVAFTDFLHRRRLQTLQSVDDAVQRVYEELRDLGELDNTYMLYTSDHGYHLGQYGLIKGKNMPYEFDLKVPFFVRGPGILGQTKVWKPVANIDLAPTLLDMGGAPTVPDMDGESILPLLKYEWDVRAAGGRTGIPVPEWRHTFLAERGRVRGRLKRIRERWEKQKDHFSKEMRIQRECEKVTLHSPCKPLQQWECRRNDVGRWRIFKCRGSVAVDQHCVCEASRGDRRTSKQNRRQKRHHRLRHRNRTFVHHVQDDVSLMDWEQQAGPNDWAVVSEEQLDQWEDEFYREVMQRDIVNSGQWYQGVFDALEDSLFDYSNSANIISLRTKRIVKTSATADNTTMVPAKKKRGKHNDDNNSKRVRGCRVYSNETVVCQPRTYSDQGVWMRRKSTVDRDIERYTDHIQQLRKIQRHLLKEKPTQRVRADDPASLRELCTCDPAVSQSGAAADVHPLKRRERSKTSRRQDKETCTVPSMNCFTHDNDHWRTPPYWRLGPFCFCQNANNNTYWCLRTVNETHNFLYCEFVTGFVSYYDMNKDRFQLHNAVYDLTMPVLETLSRQVQALRTCRGTKDCGQFRGKPQMQTVEDRTHGADRT